MREKSEDSPLDMETLSDNTLVYRALRKGWIDQDNGLIKADAFYLRKRINEEGISVNFSLAQSLTVLKNSEGVASISVGNIRELGLDVVRDSSTHASIIGLPYREDNRARADELALLLARKSQIVWQP
ncbi:MAG: hypothetical protein ACRCT1_10010 [Microcoleaceae cyanobacterium]|jgi:hypothetical protein